MPNGKLKLFLWLLCIQNKNHAIHRIKMKTNQFNQKLSPYISFSSYLRTQKEGAMECRMTEDLKTQIKMDGWIRESNKEKKIQQQRLNPSKTSIC